MFSAYAQKKEHAVCSRYFSYQCLNTVLLVYSLGLFIFPYMLFFVLLRERCLSAIYARTHTHTQVQRAEVLYWKVDSPEKFSPDHFPILVYEHAVEEMDKFYIFPQYEYPGLIKVRAVVLPH